VSLEQVTTPDLTITEVAEHRLITGPDTIGKPASHLRTAQLDIDRRAPLRHR
jgi:hypothetical protein